MRVAIPALLAAVLCAQTGLVREVRSALGRRDLAEAERLVAVYRARQGVNPEMILGLSWLGRGALETKQYAKAEAFAGETRALCLEQLKTRTLDAEPSLPLALGASIEVAAHVMEARGDRAGALRFLQHEREAWRATSIRARIQKNVHLLSLVGKPAPALDLAQYLGERPTPLSELKGKVVLLFFWAHWCSDCKTQAPIVGALATKYSTRGLVVIGPTQRYGYAARGRDASPEEETPYIDSVRQQHYSMVPRMAVPVSEENFRNYGASTTPTLVVVDREGTVGMYHPGRMTEAELEEKLLPFLWKQPSSVR